MEVVVGADASELARLAGERVARSLDQGLQRRGRAAVAVSGGASPAGMFTHLAGCGLDWARIDVFQVDERVAPEGHTDRNAGLLRSHLLDVVPVPAARVHLMPVTGPDLTAAADAYAAELAAVTGDGVLDVVHLGLGEDGHTASWPPGHPVTQCTGGPDVTVVGPFNGRMRMTLTPPAVNRARTVVWLVDGAGKGSVVARLLAGDPTIPGSHVRTREAVLVVGAEAAPVSGSASEG